MKLILQIIMCFTLVSYSMNNEYLTVNESGDETLWRQLINKEKELPTMRMGFFKAQKDKHSWQQSNENNSHTNQIHFSGEPKYIDGNTIFKDNDNSYSTHQPNLYQPTLHSGKFNNDYSSNDSPNGDSKQNLYRGHDKKFNSDDNNNDSPNGDSNFNNITAFVIKSVVVIIIVVILYKIYNYYVKQKQLIEKKIYKKT